MEARIWSSGQLNAAGGTCELRCFAGWRLDKIQPCPENPVRQEVGMLEVNDKRMSGWFFNPKKVAADNDFTLNLLNHAYGSCQTSFSNVRSNNDGKGIYFTFVRNTAKEDQQ